MLPSDHCNLNENEMGLHKVQVNYHISLDFEVGLNYRAQILKCAHILFSACSLTHSH